jgi:hypothetical protein
VLRDAYGMATPLAGAFTIDPKRSTVLMRASSSVHPIEIRSNAPQGTLTATPEGVTGALVIPVGTLQSGQLVQDLELRRRIQARKYKTIEAAVRSLQPTGNDTYEARGDVTFFGTTLAAKGVLTIAARDGELAITGEALFDVTEFGFDPPNILGMKVHPEVTVSIDVIATRS